MHRSYSEGDIPQWSLSWGTKTGSDHTLEGGRRVWNGKKWLKRSRKAMSARHLQKVSTCTMNSLLSSPYYRFLVLKSHDLQLKCIMKMLVSL